LKVNKLFRNLTFDPRFSGPEDKSDFTRRLCDEFLFPAQPLAIRHEVPMRVKTPAIRTEE
jgi:hypothetical protein